MHWGQVLTNRKAGTEYAQSYLPSSGTGGTDTTPES
jgi:hypothetical protein